MSTSCGYLPDLPASIGRDVIPKFPTPRLLLSWSEKFASQLVPDWSSLTYSDCFQSFFLRKWFPSLWIWEANFKRVSPPNYLIYHRLLHKSKLSLSSLTWTAFWSLGMAQGLRDHIHTLDTRFSYFCRAWMRTSTRIHLIAPREYFGTKVCLRKSN